MVSASTHTRVVQNVKNLCLAEPDRFSTFTHAPPLCTHMTERGNCLVHETIAVHTKGTFKAKLTLLYKGNILCLLCLAVTQSKLLCPTSRHKIPWCIITKKTYIYTIKVQLYAKWSNPPPNCHNSILPTLIGGAIGIKSHLFVTHAILTLTLLQNI